MSDDDKRKNDDSVTPPADTPVTNPNDLVDEEIGIAGFGNGLGNNRRPNGLEKAPETKPEQEEANNELDEAEKARREKSRDKLDEAQAEAAKKAAEAAEAGHEDGHEHHHAGGEEAPLSERQKKMKDAFGAVLPDDELAGIHNIGKTVRGHNFVRYGEHATLTANGSGGWDFKGNAQAPEARLAARHSAEMLRQQGFDTMVLEARKGSALGNLQWLEARKAGLHVEGFEPSPETSMAFREHQAGVEKQRADRELAEKVSRMADGKTPNAGNDGPKDPPGNEPPTDKGPDTPPEPPAGGPGNDGGPKNDGGAPDKAPDPTTPAPAADAVTPPAETPKTPAQPDQSAEKGKSEQLREGIVNTAIDGAALAATAKGVPPVVSQAVAGVAKPIVNAAVEKLNDPAVRSAIVNTVVDGAAGIAVARGASQPLVNGASQFLKNALGPQQPMGGDPLASKLSMLMAGDKAAPKAGSPNIANLDAWRQRNPNRGQQASQIISGLKSSSALSSGNIPGANAKSGEKPGRPKFTLVGSDEPHNRSNSRFDPADSKSARRVQLVQTQRNTRRMEKAQTNKMDNAPRMQMPRRNNG